MKAHVADYRYRVYCARIEPKGDGPIIRLAGYPVPLTMSNGEVYQVESGYEFSGYSGTSTMAASSVDLSGIMQSGAVTQDDLASGVYDNANVFVFATTFLAPIEDEEEVAKMFFGKVDFAEDTYNVELMSLSDALSQKVSRTYAPTCRNTLFDRTIDGRIIATSASTCTGPRSAPDGPDIADYLVTGTLTSVTNQYEFADSSRSEADDWFAYGEIRFLTGANVGLRPSQLKRFDIGGAIELHEALFYMPVVGDQYEMIPGCRKRAADCKDKFGNKINFGGQDHVPAPSVYQQVGRGA